MTKIVECVPNFSEGRDKAVIEAIAGAIRSVEGVKLLDVDPGADFNRTVYTFVGEPEPILEAAFQSAKIGIALIDMRKHKGEHARMGALDVMPFIPIKGVNQNDCISLSKKFAEKLSKELDIPIFLYANSATKTDRKKLPDIRKGEYEALEEKFKKPSFKPDYGKPIFIPKSGATATGAREILIAYNINLNTSDKSIASKIAGKIRTSGIIKRDEKGQKIIGENGKPERIPGRFKFVQAGGMMYDENIAQVSMNLLNFHEVSMHDVYEAVKEEAGKFDIKVTGSEIVGLVPKEALLVAGKFYSKKEKMYDLNEDELVEIGIKKLGLHDLYQFNPNEKIIDYIVESKEKLIQLNIMQFLLELASSSPAPGGGSVAALSGALGSALSSMVCNLTIGKEKYKNVEKEIIKSLEKIEKIRIELTDLIDLDTNAFNDVIKAFKMPKTTKEEIEKRKNAIQKGYKNATMIPLKTAKTCQNILPIAKLLADKGNKNSITDVAVSAIMANTGVKSAILNVKINLGSITDKKYVKKISKELNNIEKNAENQTKDIMQIILNHIEF
jgi:glutamate formiminotransferase/formiminotetrahydrofolate cyclodeaminase